MKPARHSIRFPRPLKNARLKPLPRYTADVCKLLLEREDESFEKGRAAAEDSFSQQLVSQRNEMLELQNGVLHSIRGAIPRVIRETEAMLVELAVTTAERLVAGMPVDREMVHAAIQEALTQVEDGSEVRVLLHADDLALLKNGGAELEVPGEGCMKVEASSEVTRGGCILRTRFGDIDARRETKLAQVRQALNE